MDNQLYVMIDTGFFVAIGNSKDRWHTAAKKTLASIGKRKWITTWPVLTEVSHLLSNVSPTEYHKLLDALQQGLCEIFPLSLTHIARMYDLTLKYKDLPMDLADASLVILAEEKAIADIVSTDQRDFETYRWKNKHPFRNLLM